MRRVHLWIGLLSVVVFLVSGQFMRHHQPPMAELSDGARLLFRSRHIYVLASGLVNLMLGLYLQGRPGWRGAIQRVGSGLLWLSPLSLVLAFTMEAPKGFRPEMMWSRLGLYSLFGGCMLHLVGSMDSWTKAA